MLLALAFAGKIGSGKTAITTATAAALGWPRASFGDYVRSAAKEKNISSTRQNLQRLGTDLLHNDPKHFCASVLSSSGWTAPGDLIIDGLRHRETVGLINDLVRPALLKIVLIDVSEATRLERLQERGEDELEDIVALGTHSSEEQVNSGIHDIADLVIDGGRPVAETVAGMTQWVKALQNAD